MYSLHSPPGATLSCSIEFRSGAICPKILMRRTTVRRNNESVQNNGMSEYRVRICRTADQGSSLTVQHVYHVPSIAKVSAKGVDNPDSELR